MKKIQLTAFGDVDTLEITDFDIPQPADSQVVIKIHGAGLNPIDYKIRQGSSFAAKLFKDRLPIGLGYEMAGEITASEFTTVLKLPSKNASQARISML